MGKRIRKDREYPERETMAEGAPENPERTEEFEKPEKKKEQKEDDDTEA